MESGVGAAEHQPGHGEDPYGSIIATLLADEEARRRVTAALDERGLLQASTAEPKLQASGDAPDDLDSEAQRAAERVKEHWAVAIIQSAFMRKRLGNDLALLIAELGLDQDTATPSVAIAKSNASRKLPHDPTTGALYPMRASLVVFDGMGVEVATYMRFIVYMGRLMLFATLLNLSNLVINLDGVHADDILSKASINNAECPTNVHGAIELFTSCGVVFFLFWIRRQTQHKAKTIRRALEENRTLGAANFSVMVDGCPPQTDAAALRRVCARFGTVLHVGVAMNNRDLLLHLARRQRLMLSVHEAASELLSAVQRFRVAEGAAGKLHAERRMERAKTVLQQQADALSSHDVTLKQFLRTRRHRCVGKCFVTYNRTDAARACRKLGVGETVETASLPAATLRFGSPPDPSQVLWENLQVSRLSRVLRQLASTAIVLMMILIGSAIISAANIAKPYLEIAILCEQKFEHNHTSGHNDSAAASVADRSPYRSPDRSPDGIPDGGWLGVIWPRIGNGCDVPSKPAPQCDLGLFETLPVLIGSTAALIFGHVIIFIAVPILAHTLERPHFVSQREVSIFLKLSFFQVFNVLVCAYGLLYFQGDTVRDWLGDAGALILNGLVGDTLIIGLGVDGLRPDVLLRRHVLAPRAKSQFRMNELYAIDSDVQLAFRLQLGAKVFMLTLLFGPAIPLVYPVAGIFCLTASLVDKWHFLRTLKPPPRADALRVMHAMVSWWMPLAVMARLGFAAVVYYALPCGCSGGVPVMRPVQYGVIGGSALLMVPTACFIVQELGLFCKRRVDGCCGNESGDHGRVDDDDEEEGPSAIQATLRAVEEGVITALAPARVDKPVLDELPGTSASVSRVEVRMRETFTAGSQPFGARSSPRSELTAPLVSYEPEAPLHDPVADVPAPSTTTHAHPQRDGAHSGLALADTDGMQLYMPPLTAKLMETNLLLDPLQARLRRRRQRIAQEGLSAVSPRRSLSPERNPPPLPPPAVDQTSATVGE